MPKRLLLPLLSALLITVGTLVAIKFAKGYRPNLSNGGLTGTGLLVANSFPDGASVFINGKLTTATDDTLNLPPGDYQIEIKKDGFTPWTKTLKLEEELVTQTNATLFPSVPTLKPLTFTGALSPTPSPDGQKIAYIVKNASTPAKNGLWVLELADGTPFVRPKEPRQLLRDTTNQLETATLLWSPDSREILVTLKDAAFLLDASRLNDSASLTDVTARLPVIFSEWELKLFRSEVRKLSSLPDKMQQIATSSAIANLYFSPNEQKLMYTAKEPITLPENLLPDLPSESTQKEQRLLEPGATYVYDLKEDKNFRVLDPPPAELDNNSGEKVKLVKQIVSLNLLGQESSPSAHLTLQQNRDTNQTIAAFKAHYSSSVIQPIQWFPTSNHLILVEADKIIILEYDGLNRAVIYANQFENSFAYPWPNGSQLVILTNLNQTSDLPPNLYSINLK